MAVAEQLLAGLTPEQAWAVKHGAGPCFACRPKSRQDRKTEALTHRAAYLIATGRARPQEILAVTFSVRAAGELLCGSPSCSANRSREGDRGDVSLGVRAAPGLSEG